MLKASSWYDRVPVHLFLLARTATGMHDLLQFLHVGSSKHLTGAGEGYQGVRLEELGG